MRLALFHDTPRIGGAERYLAGLCRGLVGSGVDVHLVVPDGVIVDFVRERIGDAVTLHVLPSRPEYGDGLVVNVGRSVGPLRRLRAELAAIRPDLLHINNGGYPGAHLARAAAFAISKPRVMTVNSTAQFRRPRFRVVQGLVDRALWRALALVICPAQNSGDVLVERRNLPPGKLRVIPYGIEPTTEPPETAALRRELSPNGELLVGMVVSPDTNQEVVYKGHDVLLEAVAAAGDPSIRAVVVGHDPGSGFRRRAEELGVANAIVVHEGYRPSLPYMYAFDVLTVPSTRHESLPLVCLEAMAASTPIVASRLAGLPEALGDGVAGLLFEPGDASALGGLLRRLRADEKLRADLGRGGRARFDERYSVDRMVAATRAVYDEACRKAR